MLAWMLQLSSSCSYTKLNLKKDPSFSRLNSLLTTRYDHHWARKQGWMIFCSEFSLARERETDGEEALHCHTYILHWLTQSLAIFRLCRGVVSKEPTIPWVKFRPLYNYYALPKSDHLEARGFFISSSKIWKRTALELIPSLVSNCESDLMSDVLRFHAQVFKPQFLGLSCAFLAFHVVNDVNTPVLLHLILGLHK